MILPTSTEQRITYFAFLDWETRHKYTCMAGIHSLFRKDKKENKFEETGEARKCGAVWIERVYFSAANERWGRTLLECERALKHEWGILFQDQIQQWQI